MAKLLIKNGRVIDPASKRDGLADVLLQDGRVAVVESGLEASDAEIFDATGKIVTPGFIDMHVHLREPGFEHAETIETGSRAAAAGGFTSICCMPNTSPVNDCPTVSSYIIERAARLAIVNVFPVGAITKDSAGAELAPFGSMKQLGVVAVSDDGRSVMNARLMRRALEVARSFDLLIIEHCEDFNLSALGDMHEGVESVRRGLHGIPAISEDVMVARNLLLAELTGARFHVAHVSTRNAVAMIAEARARGVRVTCEVTPQHLALTDEDSVPYDSNYKMKPPLRSAGHVEALLEGAASGVIDAIATDHAPHPGSEKMQEFEKCPFGVIGLETALAVCLEKLVHSGRAPLTRLVEMLTIGPAQVLGLNRGRLLPGSPGDVTVFDTELEWTYDVNNSLSKSRNTPFQGRTFRGAPVATIVGGKLVWRRPESVPQDS